MSLTKLLLQTIFNLWIILHHNSSLQVQNSSKIVNWSFSNQHERCDIQGVWCTLGHENNRCFWHCMCRMFQACLLSPRLLSDQHWYMMLPIELQQLRLCVSVSERYSSIVFSTSAISLALRSMYKWRKKHHLIQNWWYGALWEMLGNVRISLEERYHQEIKRWTLEPGE